MSLTGWDSSHWPASTVSGDQMKELITATVPETMDHAMSLSGNRRKMNTAVEMITIAAGR